MLTDTYIPTPVESNTTLDTTVSDKPKIVMTNTEDNQDKSTLEKYVIAPRMFKHLVGKNHADFSSGKQQDACEYFQFLLEQLSKSERINLHRLVSASDPPTYLSPSQFSSSLFEFYFETRLQCLSTFQVKYSMLNRASLCNVWDLRIPLNNAVQVIDTSDATNDTLIKKPRIENEDSNSIEPKLLVPFSQVLENFFRSETIEFTNPSLGYPAPTLSSTKFKTFPKYLMIKLGRYYVDKDWKQIKVDALVPMPENLDLSAYRGTGISLLSRLIIQVMYFSLLGIQPGEMTMPDTSSTSVSSTASAETLADENIVLQLMSMGFSENGCKKAAIGMKPYCLTLQDAFITYLAYYSYRK